MNIACRCGRNKDQEELQKLSRDHRELYSDKAPKWVVNSGELFKGNREVLIIHGSKEYRLMVTKADKLLLVK